MKSTHLLTIAFGMIACTHLQSNNIICTDDSTLLPAANFSSNNSGKPVVTERKQNVVNTALELPLFKNVLSTKGLFW